MISMSECDLTISNEFATLDIKNQHGSEETSFQNSK